MGLLLRGGREEEGREGTGGREGEGVREERERGCPFFLSRPVNPKRKFKLLIKIVKILKSKMADGRHFENRE